MRIFTNTFHLGALKTRPKSSISGSTCVNPTAVLITTGKNPIRAPISMLGRMPYPSHRRKSGATATLGSVLTKTRKGTSALDASGDHAMATPSATPAAPATRKAPTISSAVVHACASHGISPDVSARRTATGLGRMYSRMPKLVEASCQKASRAAKRAIDGAWPASQPRMSGHPDDDGVLAHVGGHAARQDERGLEREVQHKHFNRRN